MATWLDGTWDRTETTGTLLGETLEIWNSTFRMVHQTQRLELEARTFLAPLPEGARRSVELPPATYALDGEEVSFEGASVGRLTDTVLTVSRCTTAQTCSRLTITRITQDRLEYQESHEVLGASQVDARGTLRRSGTYVPATLTLRDLTPEAQLALGGKVTLTLELRSEGTELAQDLAPMVTQGAAQLVPPPASGEAQPCGPSLEAGATCWLGLELGSAALSSAASVSVQFRTVGLRGSTGLTVSRSVGTATVAPELTGVQTHRLLGELGARHAALDGDVLVVAADQAGSYSGGTYVYRFDGRDWRFEQRISDPATDIDRTRSQARVAVRGSTIAMSDTRQTRLMYFTGQDWVAGPLLPGGGAPLLTNDLLVAGDVVYTRNGGGWVETERLTFSGGETQVFQIERDGDWMMVGLNSTSTVAATDGVVYAFRQDQGHWVEAQRLHRGVVAQFSLRGNLLLTGIPGLNSTGHTSLYTFDGASWGYTSEIVPWGTTGDSSDYLQQNIGAGVWLGSNLAVAGAPGLRSCGGERTGGFYAFRPTNEGWTLVQSAPAPHCMSVGAGRVLASDGRWLFIGTQTESLPTRDTFGFLLRVGG